MSMSVGARELRQRASEIIQAVREGETVTLTYRGKPVAHISPIESHRKTAATAPDAFGMWRDRRDLEEVGQWVRESRRKRSDRLSSTRTS
jgi:prevent-host-death family protein